eukprot:166967_1
MSTGDDTTSSSHVTSENVQQSIAQFCNQYEQLKQENTNIQKLYDEINKLKTEKVALMQTLNDSQNQLQCKVSQNKYDILLGKFKNISESNVDFDASLFDPDHFPKSYKECNIDQIVCIVECFILPTSQLNNKYKPKVIEWFKTNQMNGMNISNNIACDEEEIVVFSSADDDSKEIGDNDSGDDDDEDDDDEDDDNEDGDNEDDDEDDDDEDDDDEDDDDEDDDNEDGDNEDDDEDDDDEDDDDEDDSDQDSEDLSFCRTRL